LQYAQRELLFYIAMKGKTRTLAYFYDVVNKCPCFTIEKLVKVLLG